MMGNSPAVLTLDRFFLKLINRFICNLAVGSPPALKRSQVTRARHARTDARTQPRGSSGTEGRRKQNHLSTSPLRSPLLSSALLFFFVSSNSSTVAIRTHILSSCSAFLRGHLLHQILRNAVINSNWKTRGEREREREEGREGAGPIECDWVGSWSVNLCVDEQLEAFCGGAWSFRQIPFFFS